MLEKAALTYVCFVSNGEGQRGYIEDLNDLISAHIKRTTDRLGKNVNTLNALASDLTDLLAMGMLTLNAKLVDLSDERLLVRIVSLHFFQFPVRSSNFNISLPCPARPKFGTSSSLAVFPTSKAYSCLCARTACSAVLLVPRVIQQAADLCLSTVAPCERM